MLAWESKSRRSSSLDDTVEVLVIASGVEEGCLGGDCQRCKVFIG